MKFTGLPFRDNNLGIESLICRTFLAIIYHGAEKFIYDLQIVNFAYTIIHVIIFTLVKQSNVFFKNNVK